MFHSWVVWNRYPVFHSAASPRDSSSPEKQTCSGPDYQVSQTARLNRNIFIKQNVNDRHLKSIGNSDNVTFLSFVNDFLCLTNLCLPFLTPFAASTSPTMCSVFTIPDLWGKDLWTQTMSLLWVIFLYEKIYDHGDHESLRTCVVISLKRWVPVLEMIGFCGCGTIIW